MSDYLLLPLAWYWFILAGLLLIGELLSPGVFLMWLAGAAAVTGLADLAIGLDWKAEVVLFAVASMLLVFASWNWVKRQRSTPSDQPHLNQRNHAYVGRSFHLHTPIVNGSGKLRIEDTLWDVDGPDLPAGSRVTITGVRDLAFKVVKSEA